MRRSTALVPLVSTALPTIAALALSACGLLLDTSPPDPPLVTPDGAVADADTTADAGPGDAGFDAGPGDAGFDAGPTDAGFDAGPTDAGFDAGPTDAGFDAGPTDAGFDAGFDAGPCVERDTDGDGVSTCDGDCDDANALVFPGFVELCNDGLDNDCDRGSDDFCSGGLGTYVSALVGNDANPGTRTAPVATIGRGIANALALGRPQTVIVGGGLYNEDVTLADRISLRGSFRCASDSLCDWAFDPIAAESTIQNVDADGVVADSTVGEETILQNFRIVGSVPAPTDGEEIAGVTLRGGAPTLRDNRVEVRLALGSVTGLRPRVVGVSIVSTASGRTAQILDNDIRTGAAVTLSATIRMNGVTGDRTRARIEGNVLQPGEAARSVGLVAFNSDNGTDVLDNDFIAGASRSGAVHGIEVGSTLHIGRNRIHVPGPGVGSAPGCSGTTFWCAGIASASATVQIENNVIFGPPGPRSTALLLAEAERPAGEVFVSHNLLDGGGTTAIGGTTPSKSAAIVMAANSCAMCSSGASTFAEIHNNILFGGNAPARYGVYEDPSASGLASREVHPISFLHNLLHFPPGISPMAAPRIPYRVVMPTGAVDLRDLASLERPDAGVPERRNLLEDPFLDPTRHLLPESPCRNAGTARGRTVAEDFDGQPRPRESGYDIGPDES